MNALRDVVGRQTCGLPLSIELAPKHIVFRDYAYGETKVTAEVWVYDSPKGIRCVAWVGDKDMDCLSIEAGIRWAKERLREVCDV